MNPWTDLPANNVGGELNHVAEGGPCTFQNLPDIIENLSCLGLNVAGSHRVSITVHRDLASDV